MIKQTWRLWSIAILISFGILITGGALFRIQVLHSDSYVQQAGQQYLNPNYYQEQRGEILYQSPGGELVPLASTKTGYMVQVDRSRIDKDPEELWQNLAEAVGLSVEQNEQSMVDRLRGNKGHVDVLRRLYAEEAAQVRELNLRGVFVNPEHWRYYPGGSVAAHLTGFVGYGDKGRQGQYGLERSYDEVLSGRSEQGKWDLFAEVFAGFTLEEQEDDTVDLVTSLDAMVQLQLEEKLKQVKQEWNMKMSGGIIMDPQTGAVKAMAVYPAFDLNNYSENVDGSFSNHNVERYYEMGSVVKPITIAAGLDAGVIEPESEYYDEGRMDIDGHTISNFDGRGRGYIDMQEVLNNSVNTGVVHIMDEMGSDQFAEYMRNFGLARKTGIDLPNESENELRNFDSPRRVEYATASFGQGIAVTPIGMARALSALANGGRVVEPYVVESYRRTGGELVPLDRGKEEQVISAETSETITRMLVNTVDEALMQGNFKKERYSIAAKTGTAQMTDMTYGGYRDDAHLHSFFGYFPAYDPQFMIFIYGLEPQGVQYASQTMTEPFMELTDFLINHYDIPPDR